MSGSCNSWKKVDWITLNGEDEGWEGEKAEVGKWTEKVRRRRLKEANNEYRTAEYRRKEFYLF
jgi:hypothetical protein